MKVLLALLGYFVAPGVATPAPDCGVFGHFRGDVNIPEEGCCVREDDEEICIDKRSLNIGRTVSGFEPSDLTKSVVHFKRQITISPLLGFSSNKKKFVRIDHSKSLQRFKQVFCDEEACRGRGCVQSYSLRPVNRGKDYVYVATDCVMSERVKRDTVIDFTYYPDRNRTSGPNVISKAHKNRAIPSDTKSKHAGDISILYNECTGINLNKEPRKCVFPFVYQNVTHDSCTYDGDSHPWCATRTYADREYKSDEWGYCSVSCPIELPRCRTVAGPRVHAYCVFPFIYKGMQRWSCTEEDDDRPWCATLVDGHGHLINPNWGYCGDCGNGTTEAFIKRSTESTLDVTSYSYDGTGDTTTDSADLIATDGATSIKNPLTTETPYEYATNAEETSDFSKDRTTDDSEIDGTTESTNYPGPNSAHTDDPYTDSDGLPKEPERSLPGEKPEDTSEPQETRGHPDSDKPVEKNEPEDSSIAKGATSEIKDPDASTTQAYSEPLPVKSEGTADSSKPKFVPQFNSLSVDEDEETTPSPHAYEDQFFRPDSTTTTERTVESSDGDKLFIKTTPVDEYEEEIATTPSPHAYEDQFFRLDSTTTTERTVETGDKVFTETTPETSYNDADSETPRSKDSDETTDEGKANASPKDEPHKYVKNLPDDLEEESDNETPSDASPKDKPHKYVENLPGDLDEESDRETPREGSGDSKDKLIYEQPREKTGTTEKTGDVLHDSNVRGFEDPFYNDLENPKPSEDEKDDFSDEISDEVVNEELEDGENNSDETLSNVDKGKPGDYVKNLSGDNIEEVDREKPQNEKDKSDETPKNEDKKDNDKNLSDENTDGIDRENPENEESDENTDGADLENLQNAKKKFDETPSNEDDGKSDQEQSDREKTKEADEVKPDQDSEEEQPAKDNEKENTEKPDSHGKSTGTSDSMDENPGEANNEVPNEDAGVNPDQGPTNNEKAKGAHEVKPDQEDLEGELINGKEEENTEKPQSHGKSTGTFDTTDENPEESNTEMSKSDQDPSDTEKAKGDDEVKPDQEDLEGQLISGKEEEENTEKPQSHGKSTGTSDTTDENPGESNTEMPKYDQDPSDTEKAKGADEIKPGQEGLEGQLINGKEEENTKKPQSHGKSTGTSNTTDEDTEESNTEMPKSDQDPSDTEKAKGPDKVKPDQEDLKGHLINSKEEEENTEKPQSHGTSTGTSDTRDENPGESNTEMPKSDQDPSDTEKAKGPDEIKPDQEDLEGPLINSKEEENTEKPQSHGKSTGTSDTTDEDTEESNTEMPKSDPDPSGTEKAKGADEVKPDQEDLEGQLINSKEEEENTEKPQSHGKSTGTSDTRDENPGELNTEMPESDQDSSDTEKAKEAHEVKPDQEDLEGQLINGKEEEKNTEKPQSHGTSTGTSDTTNEDTEKSKTEMPKSDQDPSDTEKAKGGDEVKPDQEDLEGQLINGKEEENTEKPQSHGKSTGTSDTMDENPGESNTEMSKSDLDPSDKEKAKGDDEVKPDQEYLEGQLINSKEEEEENTKKPQSHDESTGTSGTMDENPGESNTEMPKSDQDPSDTEKAKGADEVKPDQEDLEGQLINGKEEEKNTDKPQSHGTSTGTSDTTNEDTEKSKTEMSKSDQDPSDKEKAKGDDEVKPDQEYLEGQLINSKEEDEEEENTEKPQSHGKSTGTSDTRDENPGESNTQMPKSDQDSSDAEKTKEAHEVKPDQENLEGQLINVKEEETTEEPQSHGKYTGTYDEMVENLEESTQKIDDDAVEEREPSKGQSSKGINEEEPNEPGDNEKYKDDGEKYEDEPDENPKGTNRPDNKYSVNDSTTETTPSGSSTINSSTDRYETSSTVESSTNRTPSSVSNPQTTTSNSTVTGSTSDSGTSSSSSSVTTSKYYDSNTVTTAGPSLSGNSTPDSNPASTTRPPLTPTPTKKCVPPSEAKDGSVMYIPPRFNDPIMNILRLEGIDVDSHFY